MSSLFSLFDRFVRFLTNASGILAGILILITAFIVAYEVLARGFFNAPTEWSIEISVYFVMASGFLGLAPALAADKHINVDLVTSKLSRNVNRLLKIIVSVIGLLFCVILAVTGWDMVIVSNEINATSTSTLHIPLFIPQAFIPIGASIISLEFIRQLLIEFFGQPTKEGL